MLTDTSRTQLRILAEIDFIYPVAENVKWLNDVSNAFNDSNQLDKLLTAGLPNTNVDKTGLIEPVLDAIDTVCSDRLNSIIYHLDTEDEEDDNSDVISMVIGDAAHHLEIARMIVDNEDKDEIQEFAYNQDTESRDVVPDTVWDWCAS
jgi:hypothetical protein